MHNVYVNNGEFDILFQIPQILYSSLIPSVIIISLKFFSLSQRNIIELKKIDNIMSCINRAKEVEKCLKIKFIIFFVFCFASMIFFWYYLSCFCAVYTNTQLIMIEDTLISVGFSFIYPFALDLFPGMIRIPSLRDPKKSKKCMYKFSQYLSLI